MTNLIIEIPITTDCDPSVLLDLAIEMSGQVAQEVTDFGTGNEATVDEQEILVRPAGLTSLERDLLAALEQLVAWVDDSDESHTTVPPACQKFGVVPVEFQAVTEARAAIAQAGGAK